MNEFMINNRRTTNQSSAANACWADILAAVYNTFATKYEYIQITMAIIVINALQEYAPILKIKSDGFVATMI